MRSPRALDVPGCAGSCTSAAWMMAGARRVVWLKCRSGAALTRRLGSPAELVRVAPPPAFDHSLGLCERVEDLAVARSALQPAAASRRSLQVRPASSASVQSSTWPKAIPQGGSLPRGQTSKATRISGVVMPPRRRFLGNRRPCRAAAGGSSGRMRRRNSRRR